MSALDVYTPEIAAEICERLARGESLRSICREPHMPCRPTVHRWVIDDHHGFAAQYTHARDVGLDEIADEVLDVSDDASNDWMARHDPDNPGFDLNGEHVARSRLRADSRKWYVSKLAPKRYGDRIAHEHSGPDGGPITTVVTDESRAALAAALFARAGATLLGQYFDRQPDLVAGPEEPPTA